jgi:hypothetical protein
MQSPLQSHVAFLEESIEKFKAQLSEPWRTNGERASITSSLHLAELALNYYRKAYEIEQRIQKVPSVDSD